MSLWGLVNGAQRGKGAALNSGIGQQSCHWSHFGAVFTGLCAVPAAVPRCSDRTCPLGLCSGQHQLCPLDPSSSP